MIPVKYDRSVPVFTSNQIDIYGDPSIWGYFDFQVIDNTVQYVMDFDLEQQYRGNARPIHRYNRRHRFYNTLLQLVGERGKIPQHIIALVQHYWSRDNDPWNSVRKILKYFGLRMYYNRIPAILRAMQETPSPNPTNEVFRAMMKDYDAFYEWFEQNKAAYGRTYFPSMRFLALKLFDKYDIVLPYTIPYARTSRKHKELEELWDVFIKLNHQKEE